MLFSQVTTFFRIWLSAERDFSPPQNCFPSVRFESVLFSDPLSSYDLYYLAGEIDSDAYLATLVHRDECWADGQTDFPYPNPQVAETLINAILGTPCVKLINRLQSMCQASQNYRHFR